MNINAMNNMDDDELDAYAKALGITVTNLKTAADKIGVITKRRDRMAKLKILGLDLEVPIKRLYDKRVSDVLDKSALTDAESIDLMTLVFGEEQMQMILEACTEDDGTIDVVALGYVFTRVFTDNALKNF